MHARVQHIPPPPVAGPVMITNITVHPPDPFGRITIQFITTDPSATCRCKVNQSIHLCPRRFTADPRVLGEGLLNITISCVDSMGYVDTKDLKLLLQMPPLPRKQLIITVHVHVAIRTPVITYTCTCMYRILPKISPLPSLTLEFLHRYVCLDYNPPPTK